MADTKKIGTLVMSNSRDTQKLLARILSEDSRFKVLQDVEDNPDVIVIDVEDTGLDSFSWLKRFLAQHPIPTLVISSKSTRGKKVTIDALSLGAVDVLIKPEGGALYNDPAFIEKLTKRIQFASITKVRSSTSRPFVYAPEVTPPLAQKAGAHAAERVIAIGTSAGGVAALSKIIPMFPVDSPCILIVQHMPPGFTDKFAERLDRFSTIDVKEAEHRDMLRPGLALLAPGGNRHMRVSPFRQGYCVRLETGERVSRHQPSVDALFLSVAEQFGPNGIGVLLTGMGSDGAKGLLAIRMSGGRAIAQDDNTSVVFGLSAAAWEMGAVERLLPLDKIPSHLLQVLSEE